MKVSKESLGLIVGAVVIVVGIGLGLVVQDLNRTIQDSNERLRIGRLERTEFEWRSLYISCQSAETLSSSDRQVRRLCDQVVPTLHDQVEELRSKTNETRENL